MEAKVTDMAITSNLPATDQQLDNMTMRQLDIEVCKQVRQWFAPVDATSADIAFFVGMAQAKGLDIWNEDIYMIPFQGKAGRRYAPVTNYQVYLDRADQSGVMDGMDIEFDDDDDPKKCTVTIYRKDWSRPGKRTTLLSDVMRTKSDGKPMALWATRMRAMFEKCAVVAALRFYIPACRRMPYISEEMNNGYHEPARPMITPYITGAEAVNADADIEYLRGQYFKYGKELFGNDQDARHNWQEKNVGKASLSDWTLDDFQKALDIIDNARDAAEMEAQLGQDAPETYLEEAGGEIPIEEEEAENVIDVEFDVPPPPTKADKIKQIEDMVEMTPIGSVKEAAFKTWAAGILGKGSSDLSRLPEADLDRLIKELNTRLDDEADKQGELI